MKTFVRAEKRLACDLKPGDLFVLELPDNEYFARELNGDKVAILVMLRTNVDDDEIEDRDEIVYKLTVVNVTDPGEPGPAKVNPHAPPGL